MEQAVDAFSTDGASSSGLTEAQQQSIEARARAGGWLPKDQFTKDESQWVDASTFVDRGKKYTSNLAKEVERLRAKVAEFEPTKQAFTKYHEDQMKAKDAEIAAAITELKIQRSRATREGEDEEAVAIDERIESLKRQKDSLKEETSAAVKNTQVIVDQANPVLDAWITDGNDWFKTDTKLRDYAVALGKEMKDSGESATGRAFLDKVRSVMEVEFPRKFGKTQRPGSTESGSTRTSSGGGKTAADLPEEDRALMKQFVKEGWVKSEAEFLKSYRWEK